jgi:N-acetylglutamate synthase-like GNAT family acetyltransferase
MKCSIRDKSESDNAWLSDYLKNSWGSSIVITKGKIYRTEDLEGYIAESNNKVVGIGLFDISSNKCEIVVLESMVQKQGVGTRIVELIKLKAQQMNCDLLWLITTNDNIDAIRYYEKIGFTVTAIYKNAILESRKMKPEIPLIGNNGIEIRDEIKLEMRL